MPGIRPLLQFHWVFVQLAVVCACSGFTVVCWSLEVGATQFKRSHEQLVATVQDAKSDVCHSCNSTLSVLQ
jgi:hypothetical protein